MIFKRARSESLGVGNQRTAGRHRSKLRLGAIGILSATLMGAGCQCAPAPPPPASIPPPPPPPTWVCDQIRHQLPPSPLSPVTVGAPVACYVSGIWEGGWRLHIEGTRQVKFGDGPSYPLGSSIRAEGVVRGGDIAWRYFDERGERACGDRNLTQEMLAYLRCPPGPSPARTVADRSS